MIAIEIIIHRGLLENPTVPPASRLQNDTTMFIFPVHYNQFSYFTVIPFL